MPEDPFHLNGLIIRGFEDDGDEGEEGESEEEENSEEDDDQEDGGDTAGLKSALQRERAARKKAAAESKAKDKELKKLRAEKAKADNKDKTESQQALEAKQAAEARAEKLAVKLKERALENVVTKLATKLKFVDVEDALALLDRSDITIDQDEDDPAEIEIDEKSIEDALKALAKKKPHLVGESSGNKPPKSGGSFKPGSKGGADDDVEKASLKEKYPALRNVK